MSSDFLTGKQQKRIIYVDDDEAILNSHAMLLELHGGYSVLKANNANDALTILKEQGADLVMTDVGMPGIDGKQLVRKIKEARPDTPVIVLTGLSTIKDGVELLAMGAESYLQKGTSSAWDILNKVKEILGVSERKKIAARNKSSSFCLEDIIQEKKRLLVVGENLLENEAQEMLTGPNRAIFQADCCTSALKIINKNKIGVALIQENYPGRENFQALLSVIKRTYPATIRIIVADTRDFQKDGEYIIGLAIPNDKQQVICMSDYYLHEAQGGPVTHRTIAKAVGVGFGKNIESRKKETTRSFSPEIYIITGPGGSGKDYTADGVVSALDRITKLISTVTRQPRHGEKEGVDHHFSSKEKIKSNQNGYVTFDRIDKDNEPYTVALDIAQVHDQLKKGNDVIFTCGSYNGWEQVKSVFPDSKSILVIASVKDLIGRELERDGKSRPLDNIRDECAAFYNNRWKFEYIFNNEQVLINYLSPPDFEIEITGRIRAISDIIEKNRLLSEQYN